MSIELAIDGMTCDECARRVAAALGQTGATDVFVDWRAGRATAEPNGASSSALASAPAGTRYGVQHLGEPSTAVDVAGGDYQYDLAIIGSGGGAFAAAIAARDRELRVVMVEREVVGGTCVKIGCIPSKALLAAAETRSRALQGRFPGISTDAGAVDMGALIAAKDDIVGGLRRDKYVGLADEYGFDLVEGDARFVEGPALDVDGRRIEASHYLVATGAEPAVPDIPGLAGSGYLTSTTAMPEVGETVREAFEADGIVVHEGLVPERVARDGSDVVAFADGRELRAEHVLVATGRAPRTGGLGLRDVGVRLGDGGAVLVDAELSTANPRVWAAGDVTGHPQFVYVAAKHGGLVVENAFDGAHRRVDYSALPRITFTNPTIASAGLTEAEARDQAIDCSCRTLRFEHVPRAVVSRDTRGLVKLVAERDSMRIVGVHIVGDGAGDVILAGSLAIQTGMTVGQLAGGWNPYLTLGEGLYLAAQSFTRDTSKLSCCAA